MSRFQPIGFFFSLALWLIVLMPVSVQLACSQPAPPITKADWVDETLASLSLEQKVSQLFSVYAFGKYTSTDDEAYLRLVDLVENFGAGGVIFFQGDSWSQAILTADLQGRAAIPLLVSQDMEWGAGMRVEGTTTLPKAMAIGATRDTSLAYAAGYVTALEARALGVHQIFAPVADVNNNPDNPVINVRSFAEEPELVAQMVEAFVRGAQKGGVIATAKHFPGHGDTQVDSHSDLPQLPFDRARLDSLELVPFRSAIRAGVKSIMTGHLALSKLDAPNLPASLSPLLTQSLLRDELGFDGLIVTDALRMQGITKYFGHGEAAVRALEAGADMLLLSDDEQAARQAILDAIASGRLTEARIDASLQRILAMKQAMAQDHPANLDLFSTRSVVASRAHQAISEAIARGSLTLLRNQKNLLPLTSPSKSLLTIVLNDGDNADIGKPFTQTLQARNGSQPFSQLLLDKHANTQAYREALAKASEHDVIIVASFLTHPPGKKKNGLQKAQATFLQDLMAHRKPVVVVSFYTPYLLAEVKGQPDVFIAAYSGSPPMQKTVAEAIWGEAGFFGKLPITIPGQYGFGDGIGLAPVKIRSGYPEEVGMNSRTLVQIDTLIDHAIHRHAFPGAAVAIGRGEVMVKLKGYGKFSYLDESPITPESRFDLASLTKVMATTTAIMLLYEQGAIGLDDPLQQYLPAFVGAGKDQVTIRQLLNHSSGLPAFVPFHARGLTTRKALLDSLFQVPLETAPGETSRYSDLGMMLLAQAVEAITRESFEQFTRKNIFEPLGMHDTGFLPVGKPDLRFVPTELDTAFRHRLIQGEVHDEAAWILGGTAGHAGLFSSARDVARFATMMVQRGRVGGKVFLQEETIRLFTTATDPEKHTRALGWDTRSLQGYSSAGQYFGPKSYGHTGFTGTSLWIDPDQQLYVILLSNRVHPSRENRGHLPVRPLLADLAYLSIVKEPSLVFPWEIEP